MSVDPESVGIAVERLASDQVEPLALLPDESDPVEWVDAVLREDLAVGAAGTVPRGTEVEIKAARFRIADGRSVRRGRFWIRRDQHERLLAERGEYALAVYVLDGREDPEDPEPLLVALTLLSADSLDRLLDGRAWSDCGSLRGEAARLPWSEVFDPDDLVDQDVASDQEYTTRISPTSVATDGGRSP